MGVMEGMKPVAAMVVVQFVFAGVNIFYKLAVSDGMDMRVLVAYRFVFASVVLAPIAYFVERKKRTKVTWRVLLLSFVCGLCGGSLAQNLYISGMKLTSATFASAMTNLIPAITFVLAVLFRFERLAIRTIAGQAKVTGTMLGVGGAMLLTFYKGAQVTLWPPTHINLAAQLAAWHQHDHDHDHTSSSSVVHPDSGNRAMGSLLCTGSCFFYALWLILQARLSREYPFHYSTTALMCAMSALQSAAFALCFDRDLPQWHLSSGVRLLAVLYTGVLASGVMLVVLSWCVKRRGPLFASVFNPMMLVVVAVLSSLLLGEELHLGSVLGAVLIVTGLYAVLWGKRREAAEHEPAKVGGATGTELPHIDVVVHRLAPPPTSPQQQQDSTSPPQQQQDSASPASAAR